MIDSFSLFKRANGSMRFSDLPLFLIDNTRYEFVAVFQTVVDHIKLSTRKSHQLEKVVDDIWYCVSIA